MHIEHLFISLLTEVKTKLVACNADSLRSFNNYLREKYFTFMKIVFSEFEEESLALHPQTLKIMPTSG